VEVGSIKFEVVSKSTPERPLGDDTKHRLLLSQCGVGRATLHQFFSVVRLIFRLLSGFFFVICVTRGIIQWRSFATIWLNKGKWGVPVPPGGCSLRICGCF